MNAKQIFMQVCMRVSGIAGVFLILSGTAYAAPRHWVGGDNSKDTRWEDTANWSATRGGAGSAGIPTPDDHVYFDNGGGNVFIQSVPDILGITLAPVWTGSVHVGTGWMVVGGDGIQVASGRLLATGNGIVNSTGAYVQSGGIVSVRQFALSGSFLMNREGKGADELAFTSTGTVTFNHATADQTLTVEKTSTGTFSLFNVTLNLKAGSTNDDLIVNASGGLSLSGALTITLGNLDLNTRNNTLQADGGITVANNAQATLTTDQNMAISGSLVVNASSVLAVTAGTTTFNDDGDMEVDLNDQALYHVVVRINPPGNNAGAGSGLIVRANAFSASGNLTISSGSLDLGGRRLTVSGSITVADEEGTDLTATGLVFLGGNLTHGINGGVMLTGATLTLNGGADQTIELLSEGYRLGSLTIDNRGGGTSDDITWSGATLTVSGATTITLGNLNLDTNNVVLRADGGLTVANSAQASLTTDANMAISGSLIVNASSVLTVSGGTTTLLDDSDMEVDLNDQALYHVTVNVVSPTGTGVGSGVIVRANSFSASGNLTVTNGDLDLGGRRLTVTGSITVADDGDAKLTATGLVFLGGSLTHGIGGGVMLTGATLTLNGGADQTIELLSNGSRFGGLTLDNRGGGTSDDIVWSGATLVTSGALTITLGNLDLSTNNIILLADGGMTVANSAQASFTTDANVSMSGSFIVNASSVLTISGGTLTFNDNGDMEVDLDDQELNNVVLNLVPTVTGEDNLVVRDDTFTVTGSLTITRGELDMGGQALNVSGSVIIANHGTAVITATGTVTFGSGTNLGAAGGLMLTGASLTLGGLDQYLTTARNIETLQDEGVSLNGGILNSLTVNATSGVTLDTNVVVYGTLQVNTGSTFSASGHMLGNTGGTIINYATMNEDTGVISNSGTQFYLTDSSYVPDSEFVPGDRIYITLTDDDENISGTAKDTLTVTLASAAGDTETVTLTESTNTSRIFRGSILSADATISTNDGTLQGGSDTTITITYADDQDGLTNTDDALFTFGSSGGSGGGASGGGGGGGRRSGGGGGGGGGGGTTTGLNQVSAAVAKQQSRVEARKEERTGTETSVGAEVSATMRGMVEVTIEGKPMTLKDVPINQWYATYVSTIVNAGIAQGYKDGRGRYTGEYGPGNNVTYAEIAKMALEAAGHDVSSVTGVPDNRAARNDWSKMYIKLAENLALSVYGSTLDVRAPATRGAVVQTVLEAAGIYIGKVAGDYKDLRSSHPNANAIGKATALGIVSGDTDREGELTGTFRPNDPVNRAEVSKMIVKLLEVLGH